MSEAGSTDTGALENGVLETEPLDTVPLATGPLETLRDALSSLEAGIISAGQELPDIVGLHVTATYWRCCWRRPRADAPPHRMRSVRTAGHVLAARAARPTSVPAIRPAVGCRGAGPAAASRLSSAARTGHRGRPEPGTCCSTWSRAGNGVRRPAGAHRPGRHHDGDRAGDRPVERLVRPDPCRLRRT